MQRHALDACCTAVEREAMRDLLKRFVGEDRGATMVEYGLMVMLIAVCCIVVVSILGGEIRDIFADIEPEIAAAQNPAPAPD
jgi:pilus assembly protein Flp/PilA